MVFLTSCFSTIQRLISLTPRELCLSCHTVHIPGIAAPVIYMLHATLIRSYVNAEHYFLYRCKSGSIDWGEKTEMMMLILVLRLVLFEVEVLFCVFSGKKGTIKMLRGGIENLRRHFAYAVFCQAFAATLYTSCFFIKHDGLGPLFVAYIEPPNCLLEPSVVVGMSEKENLWTLLLGPYGIAK